MEITDDQIEELENFDLDGAYGFEEDDIKPKGKSGKFFPVLHNVDNVDLKELSYGVNEGGSEFLYMCFTRKSESGSIQEIDHREYKVTKDDDIYHMRGETFVQALNRKIKEYNSRLLDIANAYSVDIKVLRDETKKGKGFKFYIEAFSKVVMKHKKGLAYMKVMRNHNGFPAVPRYNEFIQSMAAGECTLEYTSKELEINRKNSPVQGIKTDEDDDYLLSDDLGDSESDSLAIDDMSGMDDLGRPEAVVDQKPKKDPSPSVKVASPSAQALKKDPEPTAEEEDDWL